ncbi:DUF7282 domain-containing protein [Halorussus litoreus]|uniref:DUF7282 domain-containing protein n=1 Tax=Halorussus litoreus TaxID=1710536 RepID=UPI00130096D6|nr:hypothetical protein [Halorussus litoreus]
MTVVLCVAAFLAVGAGAVVGQAPGTGTATAVQETTTVAGDEATISIRNLSVPDRIQAGENFSVSAEVVNDGDSSVVQRVSYRIAGNVIDSRLVQLSAGNATTVAFDVAGTATSGFSMGTFTQGFYAGGAEVTADVTLTGAETTSGEATAQETTPEETLPGETTTGETTPEGPDATTSVETDEASVIFENQTGDGTSVVVDAVTAPDGGFAVVHDASLVRGDVVESMLGTSGFLEAGTHRNVTVELDDALNESGRLYVLVYRDSNENRQFDFLSSNRTADGPYRQPNGQLAVNDAANVTVESGDDQGSREDRENGERR